MRRAHPWTGAILTLALVACATPSPESLAPLDCPTAAPTATEATTILADAQLAVVTTSKGTFTMELDAASAPIATANFVALARCHYYDGITFHRVLAGFVVQAGDPGTRTNRDPFQGLGSGGPGYQFEIEFPSESLPYDRYTVAMANAMQYDNVTGEISGGRDTNGSQFFIDLAALPQLRPYYSVIGKVTEGTNVVDAIGAVAVNSPDQGVPVEPVIIESIEVKSGS